MDPLPAARETCRRMAREHGFPQDALPALERYVEAVVEESRSVNLTGAKTTAEALEVLGADSLPVVAAWGAKRAPRTAVDLGTGNGLPGVAVALAWPACRVVLVERRAKKARAVERCLARAGLGNATVLACDGRDLPRLRPDLVGAVDLVVVRAVGDLAPVTRETASWLAPGGRLVHWKPGDLDPSERRAGEEGASRAGLAAFPDVEFEGPGGKRRRLVVHGRRV